MKYSKEHVHSWIHFKNERNRSIFPNKLSTYPHMIISTILQCLTRKSKKYTFAAFRSYRVISIKRANLYRFFVVEHVK